VLQNPLIKPLFISQKIDQSVQSLNEYENGHVQFTEQRESGLFIKGEGYCPHIPYSYEYRGSHEGT